MARKLVKIPHTLIPAGKNLFSHYTVNAIKVWGGEIFDIVIFVFQGQA